MTERPSLHRQQFSRGNILRLCSFRNRPCEQGILQAVNKVSASLSRKIPQPCHRLSLLLRLPQLLISVRPSDAQDSFCSRRASFRNWPEPDRMPRGSGNMYRRKSSLLNRLQRRLLLSPCQQLLSLSGSLVSSGQELPCKSQAYRQKKDSACYIG